MVTRFHLAKLIAAAGAVCIAITCYAQAGSRGGGGQFGGNAGSFGGNSGSFGGNSGSGFSGFGSRDRQKQTPDRPAGPDFGQKKKYADNSRGNSGDYFADSVRTRDRDSAGDDDASQRDQRAGAQGADNQSDRSRGGSFLTRRGDERAVETGERKTGERESSEARGEKSKVAKKFESSLLFADVPGANTQRSGPTNNPGLDHMSQQGLQNSEFGRTTAQNAIAQNGPASEPPGRHPGVRREERERDAHNSPRDGHPKLNEQEQDMAQQILKDNFTEQQLQTLKETLQSGDITKGEQRNLHNIFGEKLTPQQEKLVVEYLQELMREQNRRQEKRSGPTNNPGLDHMSQQGLQNSEFGRTTAQNAGAAPQHDLGARQEEHDSPDSPREGHPKLNEQEQDMAQQILKDNFTEHQLQTLKETLQSGDITKGEQRNLHNIFSEKLTPQQEKLVVEYLQELMREQNRRQEKRSGPTNNPGLDHMSQQGLQNSEFGRTTAQNAGAAPQHDLGARRHDVDLRREEHRSQDSPRDGHPKLNQQEQDMAQQILKDNFTEHQLQTLKETLQSGDITKGEQRNLHNIFGEKLTPQQERLVVEYLQELMREENRRQEKRQH